MQVVRSLGRWSVGRSEERSIHEAYCQLIAEAKRFVYIENQFFVSPAVGVETDLARQHLAEADDAAVDPTLAIHCKRSRLTAVETECVTVFCVRHHLLAKELRDLYKTSFVKPIFAPGPAVH